MKTRSYHLAMRAIPALVASACAAGAIAQEQEQKQKQDAIETVIVTAQKRSERIQDVPISITAISASQLEARRIEGIADLNAVAPNLTFRANAGTDMVSIVALRGSVTGQPAIWVDPSVGMYLDGVYIGKSQGSVFDVVEIERVEVLRGPQGTLFGRNTEGGAVSLVSRRPGGVWGGNVSAEVGNFGRKLGRASIDLPKVGIASMSVGMRREKQDGWAENLTGADLGARDKTAHRFAATLDFTDDFKVDYTYDHSKADNTPTPTSLYAVDGWAGAIRTYWLPYAASFGGNAVVTALGNAQHNAMLPWVATSRPDTFSTNAIAGEWEKSRTTGHALTANYKLSESDEVKYIFARRKMHYNDRQDIDGMPLASINVFPNFPWGMNLYFDRDTRYEQSSHELQWIGSTGALKYVFGLYKFDDEGRSVSPQQFALFGTAPIVVDYSVDTDSKAVYSQLDYALDARWNLTAGVRYSREEKGGSTRRYNTAGFNGAQAPGTAGSPNFTSPEYSATFSKTTPVVALAYKAGDRTNLYARAAKGFKSGGFSGELANPAVLTPYKPQTSVSVEVGIKHAFMQNRAQFAAAIFQNKVSGQQTTQLLPASTQSFLSNAGKSTYRGFEFEGTLVPVDGWRLRAAYGYLHTRFDQYIDNALNIPGRPLIDTADNRLAGFAPKHTLNLGLDARLLDSDMGTLRGIVDYTFGSESYLYAVNKDLRAPNAGGAYGAAFNRLPATRNLNLRLVMAQIPVGGPGAASVALWVKNATDEERQVQGIDFGMFRTANWQEPRTYGLTLSYMW